MPAPQAPRAPRRIEIRRHHGDEFVDPYAWMHDKSNPELLQYLAEENAYTESRTAHLAGLREEIFGDIVARTQETDLSVPEFMRHTSGRAYWYLTRTTEGLEYARSCRIPATSDAEIPDATDVLPGEEVLLDGNELAAGHEYFALGTGDVSPDGTVLAFSVDHTGDEEYRLRFKNLTTGQALPDEIDDVAAGGCWLTDAYYFYLRNDPTWRPHQVWRHRLGTPEADDVLVFQEPDERFWLSVDESRDRRILLIAIGSKTTSEYRILSIADPLAAPRVVCPRREGIEYDLEVAADRLFIVHNDGAEDFALAQAPLTASSPADWRPIWPGQTGVRLLGVSAYSTTLVCSLRRDGLTVVRLVPLPHGVPDWGSGHDLAFDEELHTVDEDPANEPDTSRIRLVYESMLTPRQVLEYDLTTGQRRVLKQRVVRDHPVHGPYRRENYVQERLWATAPDGTGVPVSLARRADIALDGSAPCVLYGYGAYEISLSPAFSVSRLSLLDRGFVVATAHVRGGGELGRHWYDQGKLLNKKNSFTDFVAVAEHLIALGYTGADRLVAEGGSAGGLLVGAVANLAPQTFAAVHADVPFVDALTTILNPELPLTVTEWEEWGDPLHDPEVYRYMRSYSPYENLRAVEYPAILATTSLNDTRVEVTEPAKWIAALRETATNSPDRPILLKTEMVAGHAGVSGRRSSWRDAAFELAWIIDRATAHP